MLQIVELHYRRTAPCNHLAVKSRAEAILETDLDCSAGGEAGTPFLIVHKRHRFKFAEGEVPAQTAIIAADQPPATEALRQEIQQSWRCREAEELLRSCVATCWVSELFARHLPPRTRVELFHGVLRAAIEVTAPDALVFKHSQQVVAPEDYLRACSEAPMHRPGSLNVRVFKISGANGEMVMDTRGLEEIGLHDLQCHYRNLEPKEVARVLFNAGLYIFENGPVIKSGETIEGIDAGSRWRCQFENSLIDPKRELLDLDPGPPFAGGARRGVGNG